MALADLCDGILARGVVVADDVLALRRAVFGEITVTPDEVETLFRIDEGTEKRAPEWRAFFVEALTDWLVRQQEPAGYITEVQADWLIERIGADNRVRNGCRSVAFCRTGRCMAKRRAAEEVAPAEG